MTTSHTFSRFDQDLSRLRGTIITMSELVRQQFGRAIEVFCLNQLDGLALVEADERKVNAMHLEIDELCQVTIARHQPTAVDLRELVSALHNGQDLERIGDEAKKIARRSSRLQAHIERSLFPLQAIAAMGARVAKMLEHTTTAMIQMDSALAAQVGPLDLEVNRQRNAVVEQLIAKMAVNREAIPSLLALVFVTHSIERVGDHAKSLAESVIHVVEGIDIRHRRTLADPSSRDTPLAIH